MKGLKVFLTVALVVLLSLIFINFVFANLYIIRNQEGKITAITNQKIFETEYKGLGYTFELWLEQTEKTPFTLGSLVKDWSSKIKEPETKIDRDKMIGIFKAEALAEWGDNYRMVNYEVEKQTEAYDWVAKQVKYPEIMVKAKQKWSNDYRMVKYEYEGQIETCEDLF